VLRFTWRADGAVIKDWLSALIAHTRAPFHSLTPGAGSRGSADSELLFLPKSAGGNTRSAAIAAAAIAGTLPRRVQTGVRPARTIRRKAGQQGMNFEQGSADPQATFHGEEVEAVRQSQNNVVPSARTAPSCTGPLRPAIGMQEGRNRRHHQTRQTSASARQPFQFPVDALLRRLYSDSGCGCTARSALADTARG